MSAHAADSVGAACRARAAEVVAAVAAGRSLNEILPAALARVPARDAALLRELCYGTLRWYPPLRWLARQLLHRPLPDQGLHALLLVGLYQLFYLRTPAYAAVAATVAASRLIDQSRASGLVNAVLRSAQRRRGELQDRLDTDPVLASAHPAWLVERLRQAWPDAWRDLLTANNRRPTMGLRVNLQRGSRDDYLTLLTAADLPARPDPLIPCAVVLDQPCDVTALPGFGRGLVSVQDPAAQLAALLLAPQSGERVLDACAAPGGKTGHLLELAPDLCLLALDSDPKRLERVGENLDRLGLAARLAAADATRPEQWWDGRPFDRMLLDAPCTGTGVIRRHPDIKLLRRPEDGATLAGQQRRLLDALWPLLARGGTLLYATCSVLPEETRAVVADFVAEQPDAVPEPIQADWGRETGAGRQILPGDGDRDGFFYALLGKRG